MRIIFSLSICIMTLVFMNCSSGTSNLTPSGYAYTFHKDQAAVKGQPGEYAFFIIDVLNDQDSVIRTVRNGPELPSAQIPTAETLGEKPNPVMEVFTLMGVEDSLTLVVPMDSIQAPVPGGGETTFIKYSIVMKEIISEEDYQARIVEAQAEDQVRMQATMKREPEIKDLGMKLTSDYFAGKLDADIVKHESGLQMYMIDEGTGPTAKDGQMVETNYYGFLKDGTSFDNSFKRGMPYPVNLGTKSVIQGWEIALRMLNENAKAFIIIPYDLGYGANGNPPVIPEKSDLMFYIETGEIYY